MIRRIAFDTSVFIAHFEQQSQHDPALIGGLVDDIDAGRLRLVLPTIVIAELFCRSASVHLVEAFLKSPSVVVCDLTEPAARLAGQVREDCINKLGFKPGMPDTLIATSAQQFGADTLYTVDDPMLRLDRSSLLTISVKRPDGQRSFLSQLDDDHG